MIVRSCDALQLKYPDATLHRSKTQPAPPVRAGAEQFIWVTSVTPEPDLSKAMFTDGVNENVQHYYKHNAVHTFSSLRPYKVHSPAVNEEEDDGSGVMTWLEKTTLTGECHPLLHILTTQPKTHSLEF